MVPALAPGGRDLPALAATSPQSWLLLFAQLHGQCYDNSGDAELRVTAMLELGSPLEMIQLLQTPWEERFKVRKQSKGVLSVAFRPQTGQTGEELVVTAGAKGILLPTLCLIPQIVCKSFSFHSFRITLTQP